MVGEARHEAAGVDGEGIVDEEAGVAGVGGLQIVGAEDTDFHLLPFLPPRRGWYVYDSGLGVAGSGNCCSRDIRFSFSRFFLQRKRLVFHS